MGGTANSRIRDEKDIPMERTATLARGEESLGIFVELNTPVILEAPHLCRAHVTRYPETDFELVYAWRAVFPIGVGIQFFPLQEVASGNGTYSIRLYRILISK